jgi:HEAT repeat protein
LDDKNPKVAEQCLDILRNVPANKELLDARITKAGDEKSPLRYRALRQLETSAADPRVVRLLDGASTEAKSFPDPVVRARWAWLAGQKDRAVQILKPLTRKIDTLSFEHIEAIRLLGEIGNPASIKLLNPIAVGDRWGLATEAYNALAKVDPKNYGLTKDQATLLKDWRGFKETTDGSPSPRPVWPAGPRCHSPGGWATAGRPEEHCVNKRSLTSDAAVSSASRKTTVF